tara:strand:- start:579 stop:2339 length:1761 start_codon:yes stop_codon:yes gene_type:complete
MSSITNQIVANIKRTSTNFNSHNFTNSENVVCIDTSFNRIGINRKNPEYSIDISGDINDISSAIRVNNLHIKRYAKINEISNNKLETIDLCATNLDISYIQFNLISGDTIDISFLITNDISCVDICCNNILCDDISSLKVRTIDLSTDNLEVRNDISANNITCSIITATKRQEQTANIIVEQLARLSKADVYDLSASYIKALIEISSNDLYVKNFLGVLGDSSFQNVSIFGDASFSGKVNIEGELNVDGKADLNDISCNDISCNDIECNELSSNKISATIIESNGNIIIQNGILGDPTSPQNAFFKDLSAEYIFTTDISVTNIDISGEADLSDAILILPSHKSDYDTNTANEARKDGSFTFDRNANTLKVYGDNKWNNIKFALNYATLTLRKPGETGVDEISGNTVVHEDTLRNKFYIHHDTSNNLRLSDNNSDKLYNVKYIPFVYDNSLGNKFDISNNSRTLEIKSPGLTEIFEIHATVGIKYLNRFPGDVEPNVYTFGLYPHMDISSQSYDNSFVEVNNSIMVFDNSFNYANSSLSYIGPLALTHKSQNIDERSGFDFYVSSTKDINFIVIDSFNATVKQLVNF